MTKICKKCKKEINDKRLSRTFREYREYLEYCYPCLDEIRISLNDYHTTDRKVLLEVFPKEIVDRIGSKKYEELNKRKSNTLESYINRFGEKEGLERYGTKLYNRRVSDSSISKSQKELFGLIRLLDTGDIRTLKKEYFIILDNTRTRYYDYTNLTKRKIIEFHGDYWHCNPKKYSEDFYHKGLNLYARDIWERDREKIKLAESKDFDVLVIWESDYKTNYAETLDKIYKFLDISPLDISEDFIIEDLGIQEEYVYDIEVEDNHNFFGNNILLHNSVYFCVAPVLEKKFGKDYYKELPRETILKAINKVVDTIINPRKDEFIRDFCETLNFYRQDVMDAEKELVTDTFISIANKRYFCSVLEKDGLYYDHDKMKVTGLSIKSVSTPPIYKKFLEEAMWFLLKDDISGLKSFMEKAKSEARGCTPEELGTYQKVADLNYKWFDGRRKLGRLEEDGSFKACPIGSRAVLTHNEFLRKQGVTDIKELEDGKMGYIYLKTPNPLPFDSDVIAFQDPKVFDVCNLRDFIDYNRLHQKFLLGTIKLITDPLGINIESNGINLDDW